MLCCCAWRLSACFIFSPRVDNEPHDVSGRRVAFQELREVGGAGNSEGCADASTRQFASTVPSDEGMALPSELPELPMPQASVSSSCRNGVVGGAVMAKHRTHCGLVVRRAQKSSQSRRLRRSRWSANLEFTRCPMLTEKTEMIWGTQRSREAKNSMSCQAHEVGSV